MTDIKLLIETALYLHENPLSPSKSFFKFHGHYAGPGNEGGMPIDRLDRAAFHHDVAYYKSRKLPDIHAARAVRRTADVGFIGRLDKLSKDKTLSKSVRIKSVIAKAFFASKLRLSGKPKI